jgi:hypothetical protein
MVSNKQTKLEKDSISNISTKIMIDFETQLNNFKLAHYENADFDSLNKKVIQLFNKFNRLKDKRKQNEVVLDLYILYLQVIEILFINAHALSVKLEYFPSALFIDSINLRKFIKENFSKTTQVSAWFLGDCVFPIRKGDKDIKESYILYNNLLKEAVTDYLDNFDLLNAYKHGYRINAKYDKVTLSLITQSGESFVLNESDSTIVYFSKENINETPTVFEHSLSFKIGRIFGKCVFVCTLLNNMRATTLLNYKKKIRGKKITRFYINDQRKWSMSHGGSHIKKPIFNLCKNNK